METGRAGPERLVPASAITRRRIWADLLFYPTHTLPIAAAPVMIAVALSLRHHVFAVLPALLGFIASWLIHTAGLLYNYYELLIRYPDNREHPELVQAYWDGEVRSTTLARAIIACLVLAALTTPYLWEVAGWPVAALGVIGLAASMSYAGGPLEYARYGLSELVFFIMFGIVAVIGIYYAEAASVFGDWRKAFATLPPEIWVLGLPSAALIDNVLIIDDMCDREADQSKGWRTGAVRFGSRWARAGCLVLTCFAYVAPLWFWWEFGFSAWIFLPLVTLPFAILILRMLYSRTHAAELDASARGAFLAFFFSLLLAIGIAVPS